MKKILLLGKNGQLGSAIINNAQAFNYQVIGLDREELDVVDGAAVSRVVKEIKPDILVNAAAFNGVPESENNPFVALQINFLAVAKMADICRERKIKFVTFSTDYVFDGEKGSPYNENDTPNPLQTYGASKLAGEYAGLSIYPEGTYLIRTCGLYGGKNGSPQKGNFVLNIMRDAIDKDSVEVSSEQIVIPTSAVDLSLAVLKLLSLSSEPGIYHLVNEGYCAWYEFVEEVFQLAEINKEVKPVDRGGLSGQMRRPRFSALNNNRAKMLGIELPAWQDSLKSYINFLKI